MYNNDKALKICFVGFWVADECGRRLPADGFVKQKTPRYAVGCLVPVFEREGKTINFSVKVSEKNPKTLHRFFCCRLSKSLSQWMLHNTKRTQPWCCLKVLHVAIVPKSSAKNIGRGVGLCVVIMAFNLPVLCMGGCWCTVRKGAFARNVSAAVSVIRLS